MTDTVKRSLTPVDGDSGWIVYILRSRGLEGAEGLYFRVADAAANATKANHAVVVLPSGPDNLRVVGCYGLPTKALAEFPITRGIVGREFRGGFQTSSYLITDKQDPDYYAFDERVQSELLVPVFDADRRTLIAVVNVEAHQKGHFTPKHAEVLFGIGEVMAEHRRHLLEMEEVKNQNAHLRLILEQIPDELLIIDENYRPLYANIAKRDRFKELDAYLKGSVDDVWHRLFGQAEASDAGSDTCYNLIERRSPGACVGCVCDKAMRFKRPMHGIVYKPQQMKAVVELSAASLTPDGKKMECIELARYVTQRESVLEVAPQLLADCDRDEFLQDMVNELHQELHYNRVRLYSLQEDSNLMRGVTYAGTHRRIEMSDFSRLEIRVPEKVQPILAKTKAGLMSLDGAADPDDGYGYWAVGLSRNELNQFIDPDGRLELVDVKELAVVPISTRQGRWLLFLDSWADQERKFSSDDLQALTVFSRIASATLEAVHQNEVRFRYATLGRTSVGLRHTLAKFLKPEQVKSQILVPLQRLLERSQEYLRSTPREQNRELWAHIIGCLVHLSHRERDELPPKGRYVGWVNQLAEGLREKNLYVPDEDVLYELARLSPLTGNDNEFWLSAFGKAGDDVAWRLTGEMIRLVVMLVRQVQSTVELDVLCEAMSAITEGDEGVELPTDCNANEILVAARLCLHRDALKRRVDIQKPPYGPQPLLVRVKRGAVFLAILELLQNAVDTAASREGDGWVKVSTHLLTDAGEAIISVSSNGPSISKDEGQASGDEAP